MDTSRKVDREGNLIMLTDLTAEEKEEFREIFRKSNRQSFSGDGIESFIVELNGELLMNYIILGCSRPNLLDKKQKMLCALEKAIAYLEEIIRLEIAAADHLPASVFTNLDPACQIELYKHSQVYGPLYRLRDRIREEIKNPKQGRLPTPEICLHFVRTIAEMFERHLGQRVTKYADGVFYKIVALALTYIGYPITDPSRLIQKALNSPA